MGKGQKASRDKVVQIELIGVPVGKGRPRFVRKTGHAYTPDKTRRYESELRFAAEKAMAGRPLLDGPVAVSIFAYFPVPASWNKTRRENALAGKLFPTTTPDADNLLKTCDALNQVVFHDDKQIVSASVRKEYSDQPSLLVVVVPFNEDGEVEAIAPLVLSAQRARKLLNYDPTTGEFRWRVVGPGAKAGALAGANHLGGYRQISVDHRLHLAHRLAWLYMTGTWPTQVIDHINCERSDNRWANLREASVSQNLRNRAASKNSISGIKGVTWHEESRKWRAQIWTDGGRVNLGGFNTRDEAAAAYASAAQQYHGEFARVA